MSTLKKYEVVNPLKPAKTEESNKSEKLTKEIQYRLQLIEKAFNKKKFF